MLEYVAVNTGLQCVVCWFARLKKGPAYHWDLMVVALLNAALAYFGLPMVHGALPHSPLHVRAMADVEDSVNQGYVYQRSVMHFAHSIKMDKINFLEGGRYDTPILIFLAFWDTLLPIEEC